MAGVILGKAVAFGRQKAATCVVRLLHLMAAAHACSAHCHMAAAHACFCALTNTLPCRPPPPPLVLGCDRVPSDPTLLSPDCLVYLVPYTAPLRVVPLIVRNQRLAGVIRGFIRTFSFALRVAVSWGVGVGRVDLKELEQQKKDCMLLRLLTC